MYNFMRPYTVHRVRRHLLTGWVLSVFGGPWELRFEDSVLRRYAGPQAKELADDMATMCNGAYNLGRTHEALWGTVRAQANAA